MTGHGCSGGSGSWKGSVLCRTGHNQRAQMANFRIECERISEWHWLANARGYGTGFGTAGGASEEEAITSIRQMAAQMRDKPSGIQNPAMLKLVDAILGLETSEEAAVHSWIVDVLGQPLPAEGEAVTFGATQAAMRDGVLTFADEHEAGQEQTSEAFGFKWGKRDTYSSPDVRANQIKWLDERFGGRSVMSYLGNSPEHPVVLDAGCGAGFSGELAFRDDLSRIRYIGADISTAVEIARQTIAPLAHESLFISSDLTKLPFRPGSLDVIFSEGVLHHTPSTKNAFNSLVPFLKPGGIFAFYVYNKKGAIREFTDDFLRDIFVEMKPEDAWEAMKPITQLGIALGEISAKVKIREDIPVLGIKKGEIDVQRLFYWSVLKAYYRPEFSFDEMNHINFDWFTPRYAFRQTPEEVRAWVEEAGLAVDRLHHEEAGITVVARKP